MYLKELVTAFLISRVCYPNVIYAAITCYAYVILHVYSGTRLPELRHKYTVNSLILIMFNIYCAGLIVDNVLNLPTKNNYNILQLVFYIVMNDVVYYPLHYMLHNRYIYKYVHLVHHQAEIRYGLDIFYMHPIENVLTVLSLFAGCIVWYPTSNLVLFDLVVIAFKNTLWAHISSRHTYMPDAYHYLHHKYHNCNYSNSFMDYIFGTFRGL